jgi:thiol-disulfide isomerase/thioredoxin
VTALALMAFFAQAQWSKPTATTRGTNDGSAPASAAPPGGLDLSVPTIEGGQYSFAGQAGKPMLLFASASWCLPCLGEVPKLARLYQTYRERGLQVVALDIDPGESPQAWQGFKSRGGGADHVWAMDPGDKVTLTLGIQATDTKIIFNRAGKEIFRTVGPTPYEVLDQHVQEALR